MNYRDLQNISYLSQQILTESSSEEHNVLNRWPYTSPYLQDIDEAEGSYGLTPKAHLSFSALARERNKDKRTKGGDVAASHARRTDPRPTSSDQGRKRRFMTQSDRNMYRAADETDSYDYNPEEAGEPSGPGGKPKGKKLARQIARGVSEERAPGVKPYKPGVPPMSYSKAKPPSGEKGDGSGYGADKKFTQDTDAKSFRPGVDVPKVKKFGRISRSIPHGIGDHANRTQSRVSTIVGKDPGAPKSEKMPQEKKKPSREIIRKGKQEESFDLYDLVLSHLLDEGYADTYEAAEAIMVNMSEEWRESICEEYDMYEERKDLPVSRMSKQARRKAFRLGNEINDPESGIGLNVKSDPTAKQLRNMSRVGGKKVKHHIKKGYEQGSLYEPDNVELNWKRTHR
jgi:hypothetical protein